MKPESDPRTTYARATAGFDPEFRDALIKKISIAIAEASLVTDAPISAMRTGETIEALTICLIATASMSPTFDTPSALRKFLHDLAKRIRRSVAQNRADPTFAADFFDVRNSGNA
jgi:hypothetical protein